ncbi:hypothetical protein [Metabacillus sp. FJAT-52054]|uniref:B box-type domain-containing protein n=1 Tax=Metabacillus sediminis TaxID=3117746 RepID=A0ABZ2NCK3_9BACI
MELEPCFNHNSAAGTHTCAYCMKRYCKECFLLHTSRKVVICTGCYQNISNRIKKVFPLNLSLIILSVLFLIAVQVCYFIELTDFSATFISTLFFTGAAVWQIKKRKTYREFLISEKSPEALHASPSE